MENTLVVIAGPTAVGKTASGISLARHFSSEIVSADSRQLYRECSIGTAVPTREELSQVPHHMIQVSSLANPYNASRYELEVMDLLESLFEKHELLFLVGGSGLYIDALCKGIDDLPPADESLRAKLLKKHEELGLPHLLEDLQSLDPVSYERIDRNNPLRVLKALEVSIQTGRPYSSFLTSSPKKRPFRILKLALDMNREILYDRINRRVHRMMDDGLLEEVAGVLPFRGMSPMKTVGYRELFRHLDGELSLEDAVDLIKRNTRKFARKQLTWFRKNHAYTWFHPDQPEEMIRWIMEA